VSLEHRRSRRQEDNAAKRLGGTRNAGSGNLSRKNDVRTDRLSVELKWTGKRQITVKADDLTKGEKHAMREGREFAFGICVGARDYVIVNRDFFEELVDSWS